MTPDPYCPSPKISTNAELRDLNISRPSIGAANGAAGGKLAAPDGPGKFNAVLEMGACADAGVAGDEFSTGAGDPAEPPETGTPADVLGGAATCACPLPPASASPFSNSLLM